VTTRRGRLLQRLVGRRSLVYAARAMGLDKTLVVDAAGIEKSSGYMVLSIVDSWAWDKDDEAHLLALEEKLNAYFEFVESGQVWESYPDARSSRIVIELISRFAPSKRAHKLLEHAAKISVNLGIAIRSRVRT
jgi:hypothetical protein